MSRLVDTQKLWDNLARQYLKDPNEFLSNLIFYFLFTLCFSDIFQVILKQAYHLQSMRDNAHLSILKD